MEARIDRLVVNNRERAAPKPFWVPSGTTTESESNCGGRPSTRHAAGDGLLTCKEKARTDTDRAARRQSLDLLIFGDA